MLLRKMIRNLKALSKEIVEQETETKHVVEQIDDVTEKLLVRVKTMGS